MGVGSAPCPGNSHRQGRTFRFSSSGLLRSCPRAEAAVSAVLSFPCCAPSSQPCYLKRLTKFSFIRCRHLTLSRDSFLTPFTPRHGHGLLGSEAENLTSPGEVSQGLPRVGTPFGLLPLLLPVKRYSPSARWLFSRFGPPRSPVDGGLSVPSVTSYCFCILDSGPESPRLGSSPGAEEHIVRLCILLFLRARVVCAVEMTSYATLLWVDKLLLFGNKGLNPAFLDLSSPASKHYTTLRRSRVSPVGEMASKNKGHEEPGTSETASSSSAQWGAGGVGLQRQRAAQTSLCPVL